MVTIYVGSNGISIAESHLVIAKLDIDHESLDHDPARLDILPAVDKSASAIHHEFLYPSVASYGGLRRAFF